MLTFELNTFETLNNSDLYDLLRLREEVFIIEQNCIYPDLDGSDKKALHLTGKKEGQIVAYARLFAPGIKYADCSIGRVVVKKEERMNQYGVLLMKEAIRRLNEMFPGISITISAQLYLKRFYSSLGFVAEGEVYDEDGIPHIQMKKTS